MTVAPPAAHSPDDIRRGRLQMGCERNFHLLLALLLIALAALAFWRRFMLDDAFISFRYARNLVDGNGLVWNPGERVEGYTNFLWTLIVSVPMALRIDPVTFCYAIGPLLSTLALYFTARAARILLQSRPLALLSVVLLGSNPSFAAFATGGLETMLAACLQTAVVWVSLRAWRVRRLTPRAALSISLLGAAALLTRPDCAIAVGIAFLAATAITLAPDQPRAKRIRLLAALGAPAALILTSWLGWKLSFYGRLIPNTLGAKMGSSVHWAQGFGYLWAFFVANWTLPFIVLLAAGSRRLTREVAALALVLAATFTYVVAVGGDFMEFRFLVPVLPIFVLLIVWTGTRLVTKVEVRAALMALVMAGWLHHAGTLRFAGPVEPIGVMAEHLTDPRQDWVGIGRRLGALFRGAPDVRIATSASGAIPYYSGLPAVDMLGLTDPWIPDHGIEIQGEPGHTWVAPLSYLLKRQVHLVLGHPWIVSSSDPPEKQPLQRGLNGFRYVMEIDPEQLWSGSSLIMIPLDSRRSLAALYVAPHPAIEEAIQANRWARYPLVSSRE